jgi:hypothetical protein
MEIEIVDNYIKTDRAWVFDELTDYAKANLFDPARKDWLASSESDKAYLIADDDEIVYFLVECDENLEEQMLNGFGASHGTTLAWVWNPENETWEII